MECKVDLSDKATPLITSTVHEKVKYCALFLFGHGFMTQPEYEKVTKRIKRKWEKQ